MTNFNTCSLDIVFKYLQCNNKLMQVQVEDTVLKPVDGYATYTSTIELPTQVKIKISGKNNKYDTKIDSNGNIYEDLAVIIESISLDKFKLEEQYLSQKISILTETGDTHTTSYYGFNGTVNIDFLEDNVFTQVLKANSC